jgi:hypothetical protein
MFKVGVKVKDNKYLEMEKLALWPVGRRGRGRGGRALWSPAGAGPRTARRWQPSRDKEEHRHRAFCTLHTSLPVMFKVCDDNDLHLWSTLSIHTRAWPGVWCVGILSTVRWPR